MRGKQIAETCAIVSVRSVLHARSELGQSGQDTWKLRNGQRKARGPTIDCAVNAVFLLSYMDLPDQSC